MKSRSSRWKKMLSRKDSSKEAPASVVGAQPAKNNVTSLNNQQQAPPKPTPLNPSTTPLKDSASNQFHHATATQQMVDSLDTLQFQLQSALTAHTAHKEQSETEQLILLSRITALASQVELLTSSKQSMSDLLHKKATSEAASISALKDMQEKCAQLEAQLNNVLDENSALRLASEQQKITLDRLTKALADAEATIDEMNKEKERDDDDEKAKKEEKAKGKKTSTTPISPPLLPPPGQVMITDMVQGLAAAAASRKEASLQLSSLKIQVAKMNKERSALYQTHQDLQSQLHAAQSTIAHLSQQLTVLKSSSPSSDTSSPSSSSSLDTTNDNNNDATKDGFSIKAIHNGSPTTTKITVLAHQEEEEKEIEEVVVVVVEKAKEEEEDNNGGGGNNMAVFLTNAGKVGKGAALTVGMALLLALLEKRGGRKKRALSFEMVEA